MLDSLQAKSLFRKNLLILLIAVLWPFIGGLIALIAAVAGFNSMGILGGILGLVWLGLFIFTIVRFWQSATDAGTTPWAALWLLIPGWGIFIVSMLILEPLKYIADNQPQDKRLPLTWPLIKESVDFFSKNLQALLKTSVWLLYISLAIGVSAFITLQWPLFGIAQALLYVLVIIVSIWLSIKLFAETAALENGNALSGKEGEDAKKNIWSYLWVTLMMYVVMIAPMLISMVLSLIILFLAGSATDMVRNVLNAETSSLQASSIIGLIIGGIVIVGLFVFSYLWMLYKANQYAFTLGAFVLDGQRSMAALKESARLVKGRWWGVLWKNQLMGLTVVMAAVIVMQMCLGTIAVTVALIIPKGIIGEGFTTIFATGLQGAMQMFLMPLMLAFQVKLYKAFKRTATTN